MLRVSSGLVFLGFFFEASEFAGCERVFSKFQESESGCAAGLEMPGGMNVGEAPRSSAWRNFLARTSSADCGVRVTRPPIGKFPPLELSHGHGRMRGIWSKVTEVI